MKTPSKIVVSEEWLAKRVSPDPQIESLLSYGSSDCPIGDADVAMERNNM